MMFAPPSETAAKAGAVAVVETAVKARAVDISPARQE
jgi:hypothetical protein